MGMRDYKVIVAGPAGHPMGTCRMSKDARDGVVDPELRVHGVDNLHLCGNAVYPSGAAVSPTVTLAALAHRLGARLASALGGHNPTAQH